MDMIDFKFLINIMGSTILSILSCLLGEIDSAIIVLLIAIVIDYVTGICKAIYFKKVNSIIGLKGIIKKVGYLLIVALSVVLDKILGDTSTIRTLVIYFFVANEGISILENWGAMGLPLPKIIFNVLEQLKTKGENDSE